MQANTRIQFILKVEEDFKNELNDVMTVFSYLNINYSTPDSDQPIHVDSIQVRSNRSASDVYIVLFSIDALSLDSMYNNIFNYAPLPRVPKFTPEQNAIYEDIGSIIRRVSYP